MTFTLKFRGRGLRPNVSLKICAVQEAAQTRSRVPRCRNFPFSKQSGDRWVREKQRECTRNFAPFLNRWRRRTPAWRTKADRRANSKPRPGTSPGTSTPPGTNWNRNPNRSVARNTEPNIGRNLVTAYSEIPSATSTQCLMG